MNKSIIQTQLLWASTMSGIRNGVAAQISKEEKRVVYTHCYGHALNLAAGDATCTGIKNVKIIKFVYRHLLQDYKTNNILYFTSS